MLIHCDRRATTKTDRSARRLVPIRVLRATRGTNNFIRPSDDSASEPVPFNQRTADISHLTTKTLADRLSTVKCRLSDVAM
jgi:hypothetical protein